MKAVQMQRRLRKLCLMQIQCGAQHPAQYESGVWGDPEKKYDAGKSGDELPEWEGPDKEDLFSKCHTAMVHDVAETPRILDSTYLEELEQIAFYLTTLTKPKDMAFKDCYHFQQKATKFVVEDDLLF
ncbi:predicted protein [Uncinocarpus reesii 1704]|uniref:Uncharacterized protein n=1 Tax=Uncinocarpus reesii (strain UAMH 1704) TaxID=336963 RepID=C4JWR9_UNCRE|nr:uncharacterized protein UREG_07011 [Uncinocarpus reesii 1704]EEP82146.1 predicted protein [Uncinocarpus reesii 1704]